MTKTATFKTGTAIFAEVDIDQGQESDLQIDSPIGFANENESHNRSPPQSNDQLLDTEYVNLATPTAPVNDPSAISLEVHSPNLFMDIETSQHSPTQQDSQQDNSHNLETHMDTDDIIPELIDGSDDESESFEFEQTDLPDFEDLDSDTDRRRFEDPDEESESGEEDIPEASVNQPEMTTSKLITGIMGAINEFAEDVANDPQLQFYCNLLKFCISHKITHRAYKSWVSLELPLPDGSKQPISALTGEARATNFVGSEKKATQTNQQNFDLNYITRRRDRAGVNHHVPCTTLEQGIVMWFLSPTIRNDIISRNAKYSLPYVTATNPRQALRERVQECQQKFDEIGIEDPGDGSEWPSILLNTMDFWSPALTTKPDAIPIFLHLGLYNDEFGWKGTAKKDKKQTNLAMSAYEISRGIRANPNGGAIIPILLTDSNAIKDHGVDFILDPFTSELEKLAKGVDFVIEGARYRIFAFVWTFVGDIPARKSIVGLNPSVNIAASCHVCSTRQGDFIRDAKEDRWEVNLRRKDFFDDLLLENGGTYGDFLHSYTQRIPREEGIDRLSTGLKWPGCNIPFSAITDLMHSSYLGDLMHDFENISKVLGRRQKSFWQDLSAEFRQYSQLNRFHSFYKFDSFSTWKGLKAHGIRRFMAVAPYLFFKLSYVADRPHSNRERDDAVQFFLVHLRIVAILTQHKITATQISEASDWIKIFLRDVAKNRPEVMRLNTHLLTHCISTMKTHGPLRDHWAFVYESLNGFLKGFYHNTNNHHVSVSVFRRVTTTLLMGLYEERQKEEMVIDG
ncbi:hypothetical protein HDU76_003802, partial [Blyttiomyces sp. JEL0837]